MEDSEVINLASVERALKAALESDAKYQRENDAKFRAIRQNVASYEEFRDIVLASHLKALDRKSISGAPRKQPWNSVVSDTQNKSKDYSEEIKCEARTFFQPRTLSEFQRDWRRLGHDAKEKYRALISLGRPVLEQIFKVETGMGLLGEFLSVMAECFQGGDAVVVTAVLKGLSQTNRFSLQLSFLDRVERDRCVQLFHKLLDTAESQGANGDGEQGVRGCQCEDSEQHEATQNTEAEAEQSTLAELKVLMQLYEVRLDPPHLEPPLV